MVKIKKIIAVLLIGIFVITSSFNSYATGIELGLGYLGVTAFEALAYAISTGAIAYGVYELDKQGAFSMADEMLADLAQGAVATGENVSEEIKAVASGQRVVSAMPQNKQAEISRTLLKSDFKVLKGGGRDPKFGDLDRLVIGAGVSAQITRW